MCSNAVFCLAYEWRSLMKCISGSSLSQASCAKGDGTIRADIHSVSLAMKLFRRRGNPPKQANETPVPTAPAEISLSAEQKSLLEKPIDPKANKILQKGLRRVVPSPPPETGARILDSL